MNDIGDDLLPVDEIFSDDLLALGFVITEDDRIRYIGAPDQGPRFKINRSARINQAHIEALHSHVLDESSGANNFTGAIRTIVIDRLVGMGMHVLQIPEGSKRQVPILVSGNIWSAPRVVVFCGEVIEDLGILSYRDACDDGIPFGSIVAFAKALLGENALYSTTGLILANPGHKLWYNEGWHAVTEDTFHGQHSSSPVGRERPVSPRNVLYNGGINEHIRNVLEGILIRNNFEVDARIDVVGLSEGGHAAITYLKNRWGFWSPNISSLTLINPEMMGKIDTKIDDLKDPKSFSWFMKYRCRGWAISDKPVGTRLPGLGDLHGGCNVYSSGEVTKSSCMMTRGMAHVLTWMNIMHQCPSATEKFDVDPGETDPSSEVDPASLTNEIMIQELPGGKDELCNLGFRSEKDITNMMKTFLASVKFTDGIATFFNDRLKPRNNEVKDDDEVQDDDDHDVPILISPPLASGVTSSVPSALDVSAGVPDALPVTAPDAVVEGTYDDVIRGQVGPFDLSDLQDIREEAEE
ncbi:hypothetical protein N7491_005085 [Penicillium cf. griseofulvum]|uniref:Arb2 domain-containing protein n=1 Tax=Penicillium cf. griseofulvum TaxID=2972120 RepID=A0A9W9J2U2_9EURO|nr:hypothetical protein N7472_007778 [Penicillium cf. griseofulvum]KAJ5434490.1 hypothetical protein N7491_005085 [Penicillium cf. griseofulvum]KAJ5452320.1 hypothetical protein N7445_000503 [Penicillium cf. griseofulvum]